MVVAFLKFTNFGLSRMIYVKDKDDPVLLFYLTLSPKFGFIKCCHTMRLTSNRFNFTTNQGLSQPTFRL